MSATFVYREPYRLSAGLLALTVHALFFAMLVLGVRWQSQHADNYSVELWESLPVQEQVVEPALQPAEPLPQQEAATPREAAPPAAKPAQQKADIEFKDKKAVKDNKPPQPSAKELRQRELLEEQRMLEAYAEKRREEERARVRAEVQRATAAEMGRYTDMIRSKIRHNIVMPPDVAAGISVEFKVTLLPDGSVLDAVRLKSSGNPAYDEATERAIYKAQPLPIPTDPLLKQRFRELRLTIRPEDE
jgi:colicin import membrane protein